MIKRRLPGEGKVEKEKFTFKGKKLPKGVRFDDLPDAVVEGKWTVPVKGDVAFERLRGGKVEIHVGIVHSHDEAKSSVNIYDETLEQFYGVQYTGVITHRIKSMLSA